MVCIPPSPQPSSRPRSTRTRKVSDCSLSLHHRCTSPQFFDLSLRGRADRIGPRVLQHGPRSSVAGLRRSGRPCQALVVGARRTWMTCAGLGDTCCRATHLRTTAMIPPSSSTRRAQPGGEGRGAVAQQPRGQWLNVTTATRIFDQRTTPAETATFKPARLPTHVHAEFRVRHDHTSLEPYGMSEAVMILTNPYEGERHPGAVPRAVIRVDVLLVQRWAKSPSSFPC